MIEAELQAALGRPPGPYVREALQHNRGNAVTVDIARYRGDGWSVIGKRVGPGTGGSQEWRASEAPTHWNYWRREVLAYTSGLSATAYEGSGIAGPTLLAAVEQDDGGSRLWLADVPGIPGREWTPVELAAAARALGRGQGGYLTGRPLPDQPWLSRRFLRQYVGAKQVDGTRLHDDATWRQPAVREAYAGLRDGLCDLWDRRAELFAMVETGPQTLTHCDVWPANLIAGAESITLLDWSFVGVGGVGEDPGNLVLDAVWDGWLPVDGLAEIADTVWSTYLSGLRESGWSGEERLVRRSFCAGGAAKYAWLAERSLQSMARGELGSYGGYSDLSAEEVLHTYAAAFRLLLSWVAEAREV